MLGTSIILNVNLEAVQLYNTQKTYLHIALYK